MNNTTEYNYKGYDITIEKSTFGFDVRIYAGEKFIKGWNYFETFMWAGAHAQEFIDNLQGE
jgi:hypothetical protein